jgi:hypothetical protein
MQGPGEPRTRALNGRRLQPLLGTPSAVYHL